MTSDDEEWLPPRLPRATDHFGAPTPATEAERHPAPVLVDLPPDDPAVVALTTPVDARALPPLDDDDNEFVTPPVIHDLARLRDPDRAEAEIAATVAERTLAQRVDQLERENARLRKDVTNLSEMFKLYLAGKA